MIIHPTVEHSAMCTHVIVLTHDTRPKMTFVGQFAPPCASTRRGLYDGVGGKICPQYSIFLKNGIQARLLGEVGVKKFDYR